MRVLIAYDGSAGSAEALELARTISWPADTTLRIVSVVIYAAWVAPTPAAPAESGALMESELIAYFEAEHAKVVAQFGRAKVETAILRGRPASVLVEDANRFGADLVIIGSRGYGTIASLLLGSVSAEVVEQAPCPVLVTRGTDIRRVILATDGSRAARAAEDVMATWPVFSRLAVHVVSVAEISRPLTSGISPLMFRQAREADAGDLERATEEATRIAQEAAERLRSAGLEVETDVRSGDAASEIIAAAEQWQADLVVTGTRGRSGLTRMILGSVARNVLIGTDASVLVVREAQT